MIGGLLGFAFLLVLLGLPKGRETARQVGCQKNMKQIGEGLELYHQIQRHYPAVASLDVPGGDSPVNVVLDAFEIPDFLEIREPGKVPRPTRVTPKESRVAGLACPSDTHAMASGLVPLLSYRANTGDNPDGSGGPFSPGKSTTKAQVEAGDGLSFTAAFSERLVGNLRDGDPSVENYATALGPVAGDSCPAPFPERWKGDAGVDWSRASWRSTLYNHRLTPNAVRSCIAENGRSALMGASSGHANRVNVLMLDGSLRGVTTTITPQVWRSLGTIASPDVTTGSN